MFIDSHCHLDKLDLATYGDDFSAMVHAATERQISKMLCVSISLSAFESMYQIIRDWPQIFASVGVHPLHTDEGEVSRQQLLELSQRDRIVAIGETGLDYYYQQDTQALQQANFATHLEVAAEVGLPVIVHTRDAREDTINLIRQHGSRDSGGVLHCFTESLEMARAAMDENYLISFSGIITFRNAAELREVVKAVPLESMLIETDSPYLAPVPYRGKSNEPKYVVEVAQCIAEIKGVPVEQVAEVTTANFHRLFSRVT
ncbi:TatD family hydrolase [Pontibacter sp. JAM-7]|uniref:TatD family hydrolase n=1 Tax=Pontibacter sp. JAM-7 TaxID=3366581 RepID=UPI003AF4732D